MKKKRVLLISCSVIMLCMCIIVGMSYALFTDKITVSNHLKAGNLKVTLIRTDLEYSVLNSDGELEVHTVGDDLNLTTSTADNVFGIDSTDIRIVPGSYFDADLEIKNAGNTAFNYYVSINLNGTATELAKQLKVTVTHPDGTTTTEKMLNLMNGDSIFTGYMKNGVAVQTFKVRVEFINDTSINNAAQDGTAAFDLVVSAVQATTPSSH